MPGGFFWRVVEGKDRGDGGIFFRDSVLGSAPYIWMYMDMLSCAATHLSQDLLSGFR